MKPNGIRPRIQRENRDALKLEAQQALGSQRRKPEEPHEENNRGSGEVIECRSFVRWILEEPEWFGM